MMLKLLKSYNLLFLLIAILLSGSTRLYAQQRKGNPANFSIYGDLYSGTPRNLLDLVPTPTLNDDWFQGSTGNGMLEETKQLDDFTNWTNSRINRAFSTRSKYNQYKELGEVLLYDAVYGRDHVNFGQRTGGADKSAFKEGGAKNTANPEDWNVSLDEGVGKAEDLVDVYAHLRRNGVTVNDNMWLTMGVSTLFSSGNHYVDFELYAEDLTLVGDKFNNGGTTSTGGHKPWIFTTSGVNKGKLISSGDLIVGFEFNGINVPNIELRVWTRRDYWGTNGTNGTIPAPVGFNWGPSFDGDGVSSTYGYAKIIIPPGGSFHAGGEKSVKGPPWGTFNEDPNSPVTPNYGAGNFVEVGVNLTGLGIDPSLTSGNPCDAPFKKLLVKSRTSGSLTSTLKDFAGPYDFLGASVVNTEIKPMNPRYFACGQTEYNLSPKYPRDGAYYIWTALQGAFKGGATTAIGRDVIAISPGVYQLAAAPIEGCEPAYDTITIYAEPCANPDTGEVVENKEPLVFHVLDNDTDLDTDLSTQGSIKTASFKGPDNGNIIMNQGAKTITYTPNPDFYGIDTFEYQVCDNTPQASPHNGKYCNVTTVTVNVLRDSDDDGVADKYDLDDDNDGIPDTIELQCIPLDNPNLVKDGDFENVDIVASGLDGGGTDKVGAVRIWKGDAVNIPNWESADTQNHIEIWQNGYDASASNVDDGYGSFSGKQFVEVWASSQEGLYQDIETIPGDVLRWSVAHRDRLANDKVDVLEVLIGNGSGALVSQGTYTSAPAFAWKEHVGYYKVPAGQTRTRIRFKSIVGTNFIDNVNVYVFDKCDDFDGDEIPNHLDLDSDNDGIPDIREAGLPDTDNNGLVDVGPNDFGANGLANILETSPESGVINYTVRNTDASTDNNALFVLYDFLDVDSDNDGITDAKEAFARDSAFKDANNDGRIDGNVDVDKNGWHDAISAPMLGTFPTLLNSDSDLLPNYLDLDSDGDGLPDTYEGNFQVLDSDNDGIVGVGIPADDDGDGLANTNDPDFTGNILGGFGFYKDRDGDGYPNHLDIDTDNDGIIDNIEGQSTFNYFPPSGSDSDNDGLDDVYDVGGAAQGIGYVNSDGGSAPDYADTNSDNDPLFDISENRTVDTDDAALDSNNDGMVDSGVADTDGDGLVDVFDKIDNTIIVDGKRPANNATNGGQTAFYHPGSGIEGEDRDWRQFSDSDNDHDGILDAADMDDDNDGILDIDEGGGDNDGDGVPAYLDEDDNDANVFEASVPNKLFDIDGDGIPNQFDLDSDGDGIPDYNEAGGLDDEDGSGNPGMGILTSAQVGSNPGVDYGVPLKAILGTEVGLTPMDTDNDGIPDYFDLDSDNDGILDVIEAGGVDPDGNGKYGAGNANDLDADGLADALDVIFHNDSQDPSIAGERLGDPMGGTPLTIAIAGKFLVRNSDNDNIPDYLDLDSDNDGIPDNIEAQTTLGYIDYTLVDTDQDGITDNYDVNGGTVLVPIDTDGDTIPDYLDLDSDNDRLLPDGTLNPNGGYDVEEAHTVVIAHTNGQIDGSSFGKNGWYNTFGSPNSYNNPRGVFDNTQEDNFPDGDEDVRKGGDVDWRDDKFSDFDLDGIADSVDLDDDNDGILDTTELGEDPDADHDNDGVPNYMDADYCVGQMNGYGICSQFDLDNDGFPNHLDLDSDGDGCSDAFESNAINPGAVADPVTLFQFTSSVGTDGIPDVVQVTGQENSGIVDNSIAWNYIAYLNENIKNICPADLSLNTVVGGVTVTGSSPTTYEINIGDPITYTITLSNLGPFSIKEVEVKNIFPVGLLNITVTPSDGDYDPITRVWALNGYEIIPNPDPNVGPTLTISATVGPECGDIENIAEIIYSERIDPDSTPNNQQ